MEKSSKVHALAYPREHNDCGVRAVAAACKLTYKQAYKALEQAGRKPRMRTYVKHLSEALASLGKTTVEVHGLRGKTVRKLPDELREGNFIVYIHNHFFAVRNGKVLDSVVGSLRRTKWIIEII